MSRGVQPPSPTSAPPPTPPRGREGGKAEAGSRVPPPLNRRRPGQNVPGAVVHEEAAHSPRPPGATPRGPGGDAVLPRPPPFPTNRRTRPPSIPPRKAAVEEYRESREEYRRKKKRIPPTLGRRFHGTSTAPTIPVGVRPLGSPPPWIARAPTWFREHRPGSGGIGPLPFRGKGVEFPSGSQRQPFPPVPECPGWLLPLGVAIPGTDAAGGEARGQSGCPPPPSCAIVDNGGDQPLRNKPPSVPFLGHGLEATRSPLPVAEGGTMLGSLAGTGHGGRHEEDGGGGCPRAGCGGHGGEMTDPKKNPPGPPYTKKRYPFLLNDGRWLMAVPVGGWFCADNPWAV